MLDQVTHDKVFNRLNSYANDFLAGRNIRQTDEIIIIKGNAIHHAFVNLEMRYRTYAEESWIAEVLDALDPENRLQITDKEFGLMQMRELQILMEVENEVDRQLQIMKEKEA
jgi:hypothetical protein